MTNERTIAAVAKYVCHASDAGHTDGQVVLMNARMLFPAATDEDVASAFRTVNALLSATLSVSLFNCIPKGSA